MDTTSTPQATAPGPADAAVHATLLRQAGVITRAQALTAGLSADTIDRRLAARRWHPVHPRVYRDGAFPPTAEAAARAAVLWAGQGAVLSGVAAAWWHGLVSEPPVALGVTVPRRRCPRPRPHVTVRRRELAAADVRVVDGVPVVAAPLAALEAAVELGGRGPAFLEELLAAGTVGPDAVRRAHARHVRAHGSVSAGRVLGLALRGVRFRALRRLAVLLGADGPSGWVRGRQVAGLPLEIAHPASRVAVAVSFPSRPPATAERESSHPVERRASLGDDERGWREAVLRRQGWSVVEVDPCDVLARPDEVAERIATAVRPEPTGPAGASARAVS